MTFLVGMLVGACIAGVAFLCGYGAGIATVPREREEPDGPDGGETQRADVLARLTPTIPATTLAAYSHGFTFRADHRPMGTQETYTH